MNNYIQHHGIKGQKWGVRRYQNADGTLTAAGKKRKAIKTLDPKIKDTNLKSRSDSEAFKEHMRKQADEQKKQEMREDVKNRRTMSDADLKKKIERLKMEKQLKELTAEDISPGKNFVKKVVSSSGQRVATTLVTGAALYAVKASMNKEFNIKEAASYMTPKPKK